jgi:NADH:ubiquinone oxidoreductase subunit 4 (subunit M)
MLLLFYFTNVFSIFLISFLYWIFLSINNKSLVILKKVALILSILMMFEMLTLFASICIDDSTNILLSNTIFGILNFNLKFQLGGISISFCFLTSILIFICLLLIWDKPFFCWTMFVFIFFTIFRYRCFYRF